MKFYKIISLILNPIVTPTIGVLLYFIFLPNIYSSQQRLSLLGLVFTTTYLIPLLTLLLFKRLKLIKSFKVESIRERKILLGIMTILFFFLANTLKGIPNLSDLGLLFDATTLGLVIVYILFRFKVKISIHLGSLGIITGFFFVIDFLYLQNLSIVIIGAFLLSGLLASSRLHLKAHKQTEVYLGFIIGFISPIIVFCFL